MTAEMVQLNGTRLDEELPYRVIIDRISHEVPYYRAYLTKAVADGAIVAGDVGGVIGLGDIAFETNGWDSGGHGLAHHRSERRALVGSDDQKVGLLQDQRFNLGDLFAVILLAVRDGELDIWFLGASSGK